MGGDPDRDFAFRWIFSSDGSIGDFEIEEAIATMEAMAQIIARKGGAW